jgi:hypothetical protein
MDTASPPSFFSSALSPHAKSFASEAAPRDLLLKELEEFFSGGF